MATIHVIWRRHDLRRLEGRASAVELGSAKECRCLIHQRELIYSEAISLSKHVELCDHHCLRLYEHHQRQ